jgi:phage gp37-like protein
MDERISAQPQATKFSDQWGWQGLPLDKKDLAYMARVVSERLDAADWSTSEDAESIFSDLATKADWVNANLVPNLWSGPQAADLLVSFLTSVEFQILSIASPEQIRSSLGLPATLKKYVAVANLRLQEANKSIDGIDKKVAAINSAYDAAEKLPATQADLAAALAEVDKAAKEAERLNGRSAATSSEVDQLKDKLRAAEAEAQSTLEKVRAAYRAATSQGLAQAFSDKSASLNQSMLIWVLVLLGALLAAGILAHQRFPEILAAVTGKPDWGVVLLNVVLGALSIAPAVWVAWIATKQIGQRFRLAEDYAYKAALSTAYEGYRAEAAKLDPLFEAQLFATALGRLDELPLRLVERDVHGSPWHELVSSPEFMEAVDNFPSLKEKIAAVFRRQRSSPSTPTE